MITKRQKEILDYIKTYSEKNGYAPSLKDIKKHFKLKSESTVHEHLNTLVEKGYLEKEKNQPRGISIVVDNLNVTNKLNFTKTMSKSKVFQKEKKKLTSKINNIYCYDSVELMESMEENSVDLTVTSPPYDELRNYKGYNFAFEEIVKGLFRVTKEGGIVVWVVGDKIKKGSKSLTSFKQAIFFNEVGFNVHDIMIYKKKNTPFMRSNGYTNCFEYMHVFSKGTPNTFNPLKVKTVRQGKEMLPFNKMADGVNKKTLGELKPEKTKINIWDYAVGMHGSTSDKIAFKHPAIFPEKLAEDHILSWTNPGDVVFDPMCGSGTTCKMAKLNNRNYIGCDSSKEYVEIAKKRMKGLS